MKISNGDQGRRCFFLAQAFTPGFEEVYTLGSPLQGPRAWKPPKGGCERTMGFLNPRRERLG